MKKKLMKNIMWISLLSLVFIIIFSECSMSSNKADKYDLTTEQGLLDAISDQKYVSNITAAQASISFAEEISTDHVGDVNLDDSIDMDDAVRIAEYAAGIINSDFHLEFADFNYDGTVNIIDALMVANYSVGGRPDIHVKYGDLDIPSLVDASNFILTFDDVAKGDLAEFTFTIQNLGKTTLLLIGNPIINFRLPSSSFFNTDMSISKEPGIIIQPGMSTEFILRIPTEEVGAAMNVLQIPNNAESPYLITVKENVVP